ncbi:MAG: guanylate kinase [Candidatus Dormiibacterota bacterium]
MTDDSGRGRLIVLSGPSGVGKDTVIAQLLPLCPALRRPPAYTTRLPRPGEVDGRDYSFVDLVTFQSMESAGQFLETALVHGNHYGTSRERVEEIRNDGYDALLKPDVQGAALLRDAGLDALFLFLAPPSLEVLVARLEKRGTETPEELAIRTQDAAREMAAASWYQHVVVNDEVSRAARLLAKILNTPEPAAS